MYIDELVRFGLSEKEAKVYLALLELEVATVNEIAKASELNRSSTYVLLESLKKHGLVSISAGKKIKKYIVEPPERIVQLAERSVRTQEDIKTDLDNILPDLKSLYKGTKVKPKIIVYEGENAILNLLKKDAEIKEKQIRILVSYENAKAFYIDYVPKYLSNIKNRRIKYLSITTDTSLNKKIESTMVSAGKVVAVPNGTYSLPLDVAIYDDVTSFIDHRTSIAIEIDNKEIAEVMKSMYALALLGAQQVGKILT